MLRYFFVVLGFLFVCFTAKAEEGMWIPSLLKTINQDQMRELGLELSVEDIYAINHSSLKDAVMHFGGGCTAELISAQGLLLTNHHCGYSHVASSSTMENNYLKNGFFSASKPDEIPAKGLYVSRVVEIRDVSTEVLKGIADSLSLQEKKLRIEKNIVAITQKAVKGTHFKANIKSYFKGNAYYLVLKEVFNDVRLVAAPPSFVGKYGDETDNWMWPRHTGDFSIFRVYTDSSGMPSEYSENNIPYKPLKFLSISLEDQKEEDFTMVFGFPGRTQQFLTSYAVDNLIHHLNPARIKFREATLQLMREHMALSDTNYLKYAPMKARVSNYYKKWIGESKGLMSRDVLGIKRENEIEFQRLLLENKTLALECETLMNDFKSIYENRRKYALAEALFYEMYHYVPHLLKSSKDYLSFAASLKATTDKKKLKKLYETAPALNHSKYSYWDKQLDLKTSIEGIKIIDELLPQDLRPSFLMDIQSKGISIEDYMQGVYDNSFFFDEEKAIKMHKKWNKKSALVLNQDKGIGYAGSWFSFYRNQVLPKLDSLDLVLEELNKKYVKALMLLYPEKQFYPDANSSLRLSYGKIEGYTGYDGLARSFYTTMDGLMAKADSLEGEFYVDPRYFELYGQKEYGKYANEKGELPICFIASNHTTGGNSGSPVLNSKGHLIGLNFDRSWESTMSDVFYDKSICRNIAVDMRYFLWVIDVYAKAGHLIKEMDIVN